VSILIAGYKREVTSQPEKNKDQAFGATWRGRLSAA
jgi:hypothetical protein